MSKSQDKGQRSSERYLVYDQVEVCRTESGESEVLVTGNISIGGLFLRREAPCYPVGTRLELRLLSWPEPGSSLCGEVVYSEEREGKATGMGVRFDRVGEAEQHMIRAAYAHHHRPEREGGPFRLEDIVCSCEPTLADFRARHSHAFLVVAPRSKRAFAAGVLPALKTRDTAFRVAPLSDPSLWHSVTVGRDKRCDVCIRDASVSREHAVFERLPGAAGYLLFSKSSRNSTRVNGRLVPSGQTRAVTSRDLIQFGRVVLLFLSNEDLFRAAVASQLIHAASEAC